MVKMDAKFLGALVLVVILGGVFGASALGWWQTTGSRTPQRFQNGQYRGEFDPADIRGSYTFDDVSRAFQISPDVLAWAFNLPAATDPLSFQVKSLEAMYANLPAGQEIGTDSVRLFVAYYTGLPYTPEETTMLLRPAVDILRSQANLSAAQLAFLETRMLDLAAYQPQTDLPDSGQQNTDHGGHDDTIAQIRGQTSFADLLDWGLPAETIEAIIGGPIPGRLVLVRDYCTETGQPFGKIKAELQAKLDQSQ